MELRIHQDHTVSFENIYNKSQLIDRLINDNDTAASYYPRRARSALGVDIVLTLDVCLYVCMLPL